MQSSVMFREKCFLQFFYLYFFLYCRRQEGKEGADADLCYSQKAHDNDYEEIQSFLKNYKMNYISK